MNEALARNFCSYLILNPKSNVLSWFKLKIKINVELCQKPVSLWESRLDFELKIIHKKSHNYLILILKSTLLLNSKLEQKFRAINRWEFKHICTHSQGIPRPGSHIDRKACYYHISLFYLRGLFSSCSLSPQWKLDLIAFWLNRVKSLQKVFRKYLKIENVRCYFG